MAVSRPRARMPMTTRQLNRLFHEAADGAGIKKGVTLHALRRSFANSFARAWDRC
jgi:site-specific recombinase XerD